MNFMPKHYKYVLALDPSGAYDEGKGITGWVLMTGTGELMRTGDIDSIEYSCAEEYWGAHISLLEEMKDKYDEDIVVVIEDYILYPDKSGAQTYSKMETSRLIGILQMQCYTLYLPYCFQRAVEVKSRWSNQVLTNQNVLKMLGPKKGFSIRTTQGWKKINKHTLDAYRHAMHYITFKNYNKDKTESKEVSTNGFDNYR